MRGPSWEDSPGGTDTLQLWTFSDAHVGTDLAHGRQSLSEAINHSERGGPDGSPAFEWDLALDLGDMAGSQHAPDDPEGRDILAQFNEALQLHRREQIYHLAGNHDRNEPGTPDKQWWQRWIDPLGEHPEVSGVDAALKPYPITGTWERYSFQAGNILFLMMSDINEPSRPLSRREAGGNPGGVVSGETFEWWRRMVEANQDKIIVTAHHYVLKDTTVASGAWEGMRRNEAGDWETHYHGYKPKGTPEGASYLYWTAGIPDAGRFESYLAEHPGAIDVWLGGHTHTHPDDTFGDKTHIENKWGVWFVNTSALTQHHGITCMPMSRHWTITGNQALVRCYLHTSDHAPQGWYAPAERTLELSKPFQW